MSVLARLRTSPLAALLAYYAAIGLVLALLVRTFPWLGGMLAMDFREGPGAFEQLRGAVERPQLLVPGLDPIANTVLIVLFAMAGGLVFALPVAWIYTVTKHREGYDQSVVQMVVILPIAVAGVVLVVRGDVALAFALAGIVAAVRFRTTLKDVKDAVFAFVAIGIGLASGIQSWLIAAVLSLFFCLVILGLWRYGIGDAVAPGAAVAGPVGLAEALAPGDTERAVTLGDAAVLAPLAPEELRGVEPRAQRLRHYVRADALRGKGKYGHLLLVYAGDRSQAEKDVGELLDDYAKRWRLVDTFPGREGTSTLEYVVRFKKTAEMAEFMERAVVADGVRGVELKSMKGLRQLLA